MEVHQNTHRVEDHQAIHPVEVHHLATNPVEVHHLVILPVEVHHLVIHPVEVHHLVTHPVEVHLAIQMEMITMKITQSKVMNLSQEASENDC